MALFTFRNVEYFSLFAAVIAGVGSGFGAPWQFELIDSAAAQPKISVRAHSDISLKPIRKTQRGLLVQGKLATRVTGDPIGQRVLVVRIGEFSKRVYTDEEGTFRVQVARPVGTRPVVNIRFRGERHYAKAEVTLADYDVTRSPVSLALEVPKTVAYATGELGVHVEVASDQGPVTGHSLSLSIGPADDRTAPIYNTAVVTDGNGRAKLQIAAARLGNPGYKRVMLRFAGDNLLNSHTQTATFTLRSATTVVLTAPRGPLSIHRDWRATGTLKDAADEGLAGQIVAIRAGDKELGTTTTGENGHYEIAIKMSTLAPGNHDVYASFVSKQPWLGSSQSSPVVLTTSSNKQPGSVAYSLIGLVATALLVCVFWLIQYRPWRRIRRRLASTEPQRALPATDATPGLQIRPSKIIAQIAAEVQTTFSGCVMDTVSRRTVAGALICITDPNNCSVTLTTGVDGRFHFSDLPNGLLGVGVVARGYMRESFSIRLPHRGALNDATVYLQPVRERILEMYRVVAQPRMKSPKDWGIATPRDILEGVRQNGDAPAFSDMTNFVEWAYFSGSPITEQDAIPRAVDHTDRVTKEEAAQAAAKRIRHKDM